MAVNTANPKYTAFSGDGAGTGAPQGPRIIAIANQKGGVGKTTTAINLATAMAAVGKTVLLVDLDPQGNASTGLGLGRADRGGGAYELLWGEATVAELARQTMVDGLTLVPSSVALAGVEVELATAERREFGLADALHAGALPYDLVLIDCPPSLTLLTVNALVAAHEVLVPLQTEFYALEGLSFLTQTIERIRRGHNRALQIGGVVLTMFDRRNGLSAAVAEEVRSHFGEQVFKTVIPRNVRVTEAPSHGLPVLLYDHRCPGSQAYMDLAREMLARHGGAAMARPVPA